MSPGITKGKLEKIFRLGGQFGSKVGAGKSTGKMLLTHILKRNAKFVENDTDGLLWISIAHARQSNVGHDG